MNANFNKRCINDISLYRGLMRNIKLNSWKNKRNGIRRILFSNLIDRISSNENNDIYCFFFFFSFNSTYYSIRLGLTEESWTHIAHTRLLVYNTVHDLFTRNNWSNDNDIIFEFNLFHTCTRTSRAPQIEKHCRNSVLNGSRVKGRVPTSISV